MRTYAPLVEPLPPESCPACKQAFKVGDITVLVPIGPGDNEESRERMKAGRVYNSVAVLVHADCVDPRIVEAAMGV